MKNYLLLLLCIISFQSFSQIDPVDGIYNVDSCHFEDPCDYVQIDTSAQNIWQIGPPTKSFFDTAYSIPNAIVTDTINAYPNSNYSYFDIVIEPDLLYYDILLSFKHKFQTDTLIDGGYIEVSYDNGNTWSNVLYEDTINDPEVFNTVNLYGADDTLKGGIHGFSGTSDEWIYTRLQWIWYFPSKSNYPDTLKIRFNFISDAIQTNKDGWMIDHIQIQGVNLPGSTTDFDKNNNQIKIFPHPLEVSSTIKFNNLSSESMTLNIYNLSGKKVKTVSNITTNQFEVRKNDLSEGVYLLKIQDSKGNYQTGKLLVK